MDRYKKITEEILDMAKKDQDFRLSIDAKNITEEEQEKMSSMDKQNTERIEEIIKDIGYPTISKVGEKASNAAWLLVQHASNLGFQKRVLELMKSAPEGEVKKENIAYLEDRILVREGKPQIYGTQHNLEDGVWVPFKIESAEHVDERREAVGLIPLNENTKNLNQKQSSHLE